MLINFLVCFVICIIIIYIFTNINYKTYILKTKIQCTRCKKAPIIKLKDPVFLKGETTQYCTSCLTELAYVVAENDFIPKYNSWFIRTNTAMIINN